MAGVKDTAHCLLPFRAAPAVPALVFPASCTFLPHSCASTAVFMGPSQANEVLVKNSSAEEKAYFYPEEFTDRVTTGACKQGIA